MRNSVPTYSFHSPDDLPTPLNDDALLPRSDDLDPLADDLGDALPESDLDDFGE